MAKYLFLNKKLTAIPVNFISNSKDESYKRTLEKQLIKKKYSFSFPKPIKISDLEINIEILDTSMTDVLNLHLFGINKKNSSEEYREISYIISSSNHFTFSDSPSQNNNFLVSDFAFTSTGGKINISFSVHELKEDES